MNNEIKKLIENATSEEEVKKILKENNVELTDEELENVSGGAIPRRYTLK